MFKTYDYTCRECHYTWTHTQDGYEAKFNCKLCPECGSKKIVRHVAAPTVHVFYSPMHPRHMRGMKKR